LSLVIKDSGRNIISGAFFGPEPVHNNAEFSLKKKKKRIKSSFRKENKTLNSGVKKQNCTHQQSFNIINS